MCKKPGANQRCCPKPFVAPAPADILYASDRQNPTALSHESNNQTDHIHPPIQPLTAQGECRLRCHSQQQKCQREQVIAVAKQEVSEAYRPGPTSPFERKHVPLTRKNPPGCSEC